MSQEPGPLWIAFGNAKSGSQPGTAVEPVRVYVQQFDSSVPFMSAWTSEENDYARGVAWGDYNGDGSLDLAVANGFLSARRDRVYQSVGRDVSTLSTIYTVPQGANSRDVEWGDLDGDGLLDFVVAGAEGVTLFRQNAGDNFAGNLIVATSPSQAEDLDLADFDGDGDLDLAIASTGTDRVYRNNGSGQFALAWEQEFEEDSSSIAWGDYDGDGDLDLVVGGTYLIVRNNLGGEFDVIAFSAFDVNVRDNPTGVAWLDYDGDGDLDIAASFCRFPEGGGACGPARNHVFRNTGGTFSIGWSSVEEDVSNDVAIADHNHDGREDVVFANSGVNRLYEAIPSGFQLAWSSSESEVSTSVDVVEAPRPTSIR